MKKITFISAAMLILASCSIIKNPEQSSLINIEPIKKKNIPPPVRIPILSLPVPLPPKIKSINWHTSLSPIVKRMLAIDGIHNGSLLLVNKLNNATNGTMQTSKATSTLINLILEEKTKFLVVSGDKLDIARQKLGISAEDNLESRSKAIGLARYLNAHYVLYSAASGNVKAPKIDLQLILAQTGEIIWSGDGIAQN